jgi:hypothetical protein
LPTDTSSDSAHGTYGIVLGTHPPNMSAFHDVRGGEPWHQAAIYRVDYDFRHRSTDTTDTVDTREVHPTKDDPGGVLRHHPDIDGAVGDDSRIQLPVVDTSGRATIDSVVRTAG